MGVSSAVTSGGAWGAVPPPLKNFCAPPEKIFWLIEIGPQWNFVLYMYSTVQYIVLIVKRCVMCVLNLIE